MSFKRFLIWSSGAPCSMEQNLKCKFERGHNEHSCADISNLDQWFRRRCCLKIFLICSAGAPFVHLCHFCRGLQEEQFCEIILNLNHWFKRRCRLKTYLSGALAPTCSVERNHLCNFKRGHHEKHSSEVI